MNNLFVGISIIAIIYIVLNTPSLKKLLEPILPNLDNSKFREAIMTTTRQAARWSTASEQDKNPFIANLHANYGAGYLFALQGMGSVKEIEGITGIDMKKFEKVILQTQDRAAKKLLKNLPQSSTK